MEELLNKITCCDCLEGMKKLDDECIDTVMTSPPYWALRDYGVEGQLGLEKTFDEYISKLCDIFDEVKRVLKKEGTIWVNLGDTYSRDKRKKDGINHTLNKKNKEVHIEPLMNPNYGLPDKCLTLIPFRFAIEMVNRGWILRNTIIWHKRNCMPSSAKDRFTVDFEYLFFFSKSKKYYFERQFEKYQESSLKRIPIGRVEERPQQTEEQIKGVGYKLGYKKLQLSGLGRNKRTVWTINPKPFPEAHFAVYPEELCETPIKSGCPKFVCTKCGKSREKIIELGKHSKEPKRGTQPSTNRAIGSPQQSTSGGMPIRESIIKGYTICSCNAPFKPGIVLDPFMGAGTTAVVAKKLGRQYIGFELKQEYIDIANKRINKVPRKLSEFDETLENFDDYTYLDEYEALISPRPSNYIE